MFEQRFHMQKFGSSLTFLYLVAIAGKVTFRLGIFSNNFVITGLTSTTNDLIYRIFFVIFVIFFRLFSRNRSN